MYNCMSGEQEDFEHDYARWDRRPFEAYEQEARDYKAFAVRINEHLISD